MPTINGTSGNETLTGTAEDDFIYGWEGDDTLYGGSGDDYLYGENVFSLGGYQFTGNDTLIGGEGNDHLYGGAGTDIMRGGPGNDDYGVHEVSDVVEEAPDEGRDGVWATIPYTLGPNVEALLMAGDNLVGTGNHLDNELSGLSSANDRNLLYGLGGDDLIIGYGGDDTLDGGSGNDTLQGGEGKDTILGGDGGDFLWTLFGGGDILTGGSGIDVFYGRLSELNGATITDLEVGDRIVFAGQGVEPFAFDFQFSGNTLTFTSGSLTLQNLPPGTQLVVTTTPLTGYPYQHFANAHVELVLVAIDARNDFNGDGRSDILWRNDNGTVTDWLGTASGGFTENHGALSVNVPNDWNIVGSGDFNGDGRDDMLWLNDNGVLTNWLATANGGFTENYGAMLEETWGGWNVPGTGDFNGDGRDDILLRYEDGTLTDWLGTANGGFAKNHSVLSRPVPTDWSIAGTGDFNGDGRDDILWRNDNGTLTDWLGTASGGFVDNYAALSVQVPTEWKVAGVGDFNGDGRDDILWRHENGTLTNWLGTASGGFAENFGALSVQVSTDWQVADTGDFNGDGRDDLLWRNANGTLTDWLGTAGGGFAENYAALSLLVPANWHVQDYLLA